MENTNKAKSIRSAFAKMGLAMLAIALLTLMGQYAAAFLASTLAADAADSSLVMWLCAFAPQYVVAIPVGYLMLRQVPCAAPKQMKLKTNELLAFLLMCFPVMYGGNLVGTVLSSVLSGGAAENALIDFALDQSPLKIILTVLLAPIAEEFIFRKQLIDRAKGLCGEGAAIVFSSAVFALMHMNFYQLFYAFGVGLLFSYIYVRTGRIRYTVAIHAAINFLGIVVAPWVLTQTQLLSELDVSSLGDAAALAQQVNLLGSSLNNIMLCGVYFVSVIALTVAGLVVLIKLRTRFFVLKPDAAPPKRELAKVMYINAGMLPYAAYCAVIMIIGLFAQN